jgi:hypothetical protein
VAKRARTKKAKGLEKYGTATVINRSTANLTDLEQLAGHEPMGSRKSAAFDTRVRITVVSYRVTLADADGISAKAAIDGLVHAGILADDSTEEIEEVRYRQIKVDTSGEEKTIIEIEAVGTDGPGVSQCR